LAVYQRLPKERQNLLNAAIDLEISGDFTS
jgi:hypothetical protein